MLKNPYTPNLLDSKIKSSSDNPKEQVTVRRKKIPMPDAHVDIDLEDVRTSEYLYSASIGDILSFQVDLSTKYCVGCEVKNGNVNYCSGVCPVSIQLLSIGDAYSDKMAKLREERRGIRSIELETGKSFSGLRKPELIEVSDNDYESYY